MSLTMKMLRQHSTQTGMALLLSALLAPAAMAQDVKSYDFGASALKGYSIAPNDDAQDNGISIAGTLDPSVANNFVHFMSASVMGNVTASLKLQFGVSHVRAISIANITKGKFALTVQMQIPGAMNRIGVVFMDALGNISSSVAIDQPASAAMRNLYPMHTLAYKGKLYICGYSVADALYPADPTFLDQKRAFIASLDMKSSAITLKDFNSTQYSGSIPFPYPGGVNDYDMANRLKILNGRLYVLGSANGAAYSYTAGYPIYYINSSKAWVAEINQTTLAPVTESFFGKDMTLPYVTPISTDGSFGVDIVEDKETPGEFYVYNNSMNTKCWWMSHVDNTLKITTPMYGNSSICYPIGGSYKGFGAFNVPNTTTNRITMYGTVGTNVPLTNPGVYGTIIENVTNGAVPFAMSMDVSYDATMGVSWSSESGYLEGNAIGYATGLNYEAPFFSQSGMGEWCTVAFGIQADPANGNSHLQMAGYVGLPAGSGSVQPRLLRSDANGKTYSCPTSQELDLSLLGPVGLNDYPSQIKIDDVTPIVKAISVKRSKLDLIKDYDCSNSGVYRTAQPGAMELGSSKGLYPNPANDQVTVMLGSDAAEGATVKVTLTDITGRVVLVNETQATGGKLVLNLARFTAGVYQVRVSINQGTPAVHKLVIQ